MNDVTTVITAGEIGPPGPPGSPGPPGGDGPAGPPGYGQAVFTMEGVLVVRAGTLRWRVNQPLTIIGVAAVVGTSPVGFDIIVDVNLNGTTIFTDQSLRPMISPGSNDSGIRFPSITSLNEGDYLTADVDQVGSTPGTDLTIQVLLR